MSAAASLLLLLLLAAGCGKGKTSAADQGSASDAASEEKEDHEDSETSSYTPRRSRTDEEQCDLVARDMLAKLRAQAERLNKRGAELVERERLLQGRSEELAAQAKQNAEGVKLAEQACKDPMRMSRDAQVRATSELVDGMPALKAAALLSEMRDSQLASSVLRSLAPERAGKVLAQMKPDVAARLMELREDTTAAKTAQSQAVQSRAEAAQSQATAPEEKDDAEEVAAQAARQRRRARRLTRAAAEEAAQATAPKADTAAETAKASSQPKTETNEDKVETPAPQVPRGPRQAETQSGKPL